MQQQPHFSAMSAMSAISAISTSRDSNMANELSQLVKALVMHVQLGLHKEGVAALSWHCFRKAPPTMPAPAALKKRPTPTVSH